MMKDEGGMMQKGSYEAYAPEKIARAETGDVVLFFHASWCPSCRGLNADIEKHLETIPAQLSILKVDYDTETELKKKYGVTYQHTLVQVDKDGNLIKKWSGSPALSVYGSCALHIAIASGGYRRVRKRRALHLKASTRRYRIAFCVGRCLHASVKSVDTAH
jgi:thiol-disulfide isomerase/thioredoxin